MTRRNQNLFEIRLSHTRLIHFVFTELQRLISTKAAFPLSASGFNIQNRVRLYLLLTKIVARSYLLQNLTKITFFLFLGEITHWYLPLAINNTHVCTKKYGFVCNKVICFTIAAKKGDRRPSFNPCTQDPRILNPRIQDPQS